MTRRPDRVAVDIEAEMALIGDMIGLPDVIADVTRAVAVGDFADLRCAEAFRALVDGYEQGRVLDAVALNDVLFAAGHPKDARWAAEVMSLATGAWKAHGDIVVRHRITRDAITVAQELSAALLDPANDPLELVDQAQGRLASIDKPVASAPASLSTVDEFLARPETARSPWVIPGLLRADWRCIVVGNEGGGKSLLLRQFAALAAQGIHPLDPGQQIPRQRSLLVDLENPADALDQTFRSLIRPIAAHEYEPGRAWLWHEPGGINLRSRSDRAKFEAVLAESRPQLVCAGPVYKLYERTGSESDEDATADLMRVLDDMRTRYGFALLMEAHAPQEQSGYRKLRPFGSSRWLRWPELGLAMEPDDRLQGHSVTLNRWRGDRMSNDWPKYLNGGGQWPWVAGFE